MHIYEKINRNYKSGKSRQYVLDNKLLGLFNKVLCSGNRAVSDLFASGIY